MVATGFILNQSFVDLIRALTEEEARSTTYGVTSSDNSATLSLPAGTQWAVSATLEGYQVTLPDGRQGTGTTVADALAAARAELITP
jgi:hypothetical protein